MTLGQLIRTLESYRRSTLDDGDVVVISVPTEPHGDDAYGSGVYLDITDAERDSFDSVMLTTRHSEDVVLVQRRPGDPAQPELSGDEWDAVERALAYYNAQIEAGIAAGGTDGDWYAQRAAARIREDRTAGVPVKG